MQTVLIIQRFVCLHVQPAAQLQEALGLGGTPAANRRRGGLLCGMAAALTLVGVCVCGWVYLYVGVTLVHCPCTSYDIVSAALSLAACLDCPYLAANRSTATLISEPRHKITPC